jgi:hypothetical protein
MTRTRWRARRAAGPGRAEPLEQPFAPAWGAGAAGAAATAAGASGEPAARPRGSERSRCLTVGSGPWRARTYAKSLWPGKLAIVRRRVGALHRSSSPRWPQFPDPPGRRFLPIALRTSGVCSPSPPAWRSRASPLTATLVVHVSPSSARRLAVSSCWCAARAPRPRRRRRPERRRHRRGSRPGTSSGWARVRRLALVRPAAAAPARAPGWDPAFHTTIVELIRTRAACPTPGPLRARDAQLPLGFTPWSGRARPSAAPLEVAFAWAFTSPASSSSRWSTRSPALRQARPPSDRRASLRLTRAGDADSHAAWGGLPNLVAWVMAAFVLLVTARAPAHLLAAPAPPPRRSCSTSVRPAGFCVAVWVLHRARHRAPDVAARPHRLRAMAAAT